MSMNVPEIQTNYVKKIIQAVQSPTPEMLLNTRRQLYNRFATAWLNRYFVNDEFASGKGNLAFLQIEGEGGARASWMTSGSWITYAHKYKPILFQLEHRYYGKSHPTEDLSNENLVYLTSQQALGDLAFFIEAMNQNHNLTRDVKWIVFGGSYAGNLAAWVRLKYPHLVHGAMSASAPLLAKLDFPEYLEDIEDSLRASNEKCSTILKQSIDQIDVLLHTAVGQKNLNDLFNLCEDISKNVHNSLDMYNFFMNLIIEVFAFVIQDNTAPDWLCGSLLDESIGPEINRLANIYKLVTNTSTQCLSYKYDKDISIIQNRTWESRGNFGDRQWTYQTCTEFGYYQTHPKFPLSFFVQRCQDIFRSSHNEMFLDRAINRTNVFYGGLDIEVSNVVFVHGSLDPWRLLGITKTLNEKAPVIMIEGAGHCANMYNPSEYDTPQLTAARVQIGELIGTWINS
ncbi:putative serine protease K12H4.7 [Diabrotica undecimpunctata]|uniref:putative serine protease K12H4.7 n=1 Tax=Diabrotica undecimpunctata TaxID=50387 RepID=UPI003B63D604